MLESPYKNVGFVIVKQRNGKLAWQPMHQRIKGGVTLLYGEQDRRGCYFNDGSYSYPLSPARGESGRLIDMITSAYDALYRPIAESIRQEFSKVWGNNPRINDVHNCIQFLEVVVDGSTHGLGLPSSFMGLEIRCSPLHQPNMAG